MGQIVIFGQNLYLNSLDSGKYEYTVSVNEQDISKKGNFVVNDFFQKCIEDKSVYFLIFFLKEIFYTFYIIFNKYYYIWLCNLTNKLTSNLNVINTLRDKFDCDVGYSGHEAGLAISYAAVSFGITSLERHITLSRAMYGSDQAASVEPAGIKQLVGGVRTIVRALGSGNKKIIDAEKPIAKKLREHLYK